MAAMEMATIAEEPAGSGKDVETDLSTHVRKESIDDIMNRYSPRKRNSSATKKESWALNGPTPDGSQFLFNEEGSSEPEGLRIEDQPTHTSLPPIGRTEERISLTSRGIEHEETEAMEEERPVAIGSSSENITENQDSGENYRATTQSEENVTPDRGPAESPPPHDQRNADTSTGEHKNLPDDKGNKGPSAERDGDPNGRLLKNTWANGNVPVSSENSSETSVDETTSRQENTIGETSARNQSATERGRLRRNNDQDNVPTAGPSREPVGLTAGTSTEPDNNPESGEDDWESELTVSDENKEDNQGDSGETDDVFSDNLRRALRLTAVAFVFLVVLCCSVACKLTLLHMEARLHCVLNVTCRNALFPAPTTTDAVNLTIPVTNTTTADNQTTAASSCRDRVEQDPVVIYLALIIVIPYAITLLRCVWISLMNWNYEPNPSRRHIILGTLLAVLEVLSLSSLVLWALPASPSIGLIVVNIVFMNPVLTKSVHSFKGDKDGNQSKVKGISFSVLFVLILVCLATTGVPDQHVTAQNVTAQNVTAQNVTAQAPQNAKALLPQNARALPPQNVKALPPQNVKALPPQNVRALNGTTVPPQTTPALPPQTTPALPPQITTALTTAAASNHTLTTQNGTTATESSTAEPDQTSTSETDQTSTAEPDENSTAEPELDQDWSNLRPHIYVSLALLAISWTPILHKLSVSKDNTVHPDDAERGSTIGPNKTQNNTACWKLGIITNLVKCLVWALFLLLFYPLTRGQDPFCINWHIPPVSTDYSVFVSFLANGIFGLFGYAFAILALMMKMQTFGFLLPIFLSNAAVSLFLIIGTQTQLCYDIPLVKELGLCKPGNWPWEHTEWAILVCSSLVFVTMLGMAVQLYDVWQEPPDNVMEKESKLLWTPGYNSVLLDQWMLLTRRTNLPGQRGPPSQSEVELRSAGTEKTRVFICTTMYHEIAKEMKQLMSSLWDMAQTQTEFQIEESKVEFEAHIFFDDGYKNGQVQDFALQLLSIIDSMGDRDGPSLIQSCEKWQTPYGLQLEWKLPSSEGPWNVNNGMKLTLHLKDNTKVKNKKRWSQIMYMSYVLDYVMKCQAGGRNQRRSQAARRRQKYDRNTYILATDADVKFTPESARALLDLARRDPTVGAVCGRTHPLGSGPMVWYQKFDYAVGHWYQKTTNSVLGSVLCCPGCFSIYRAEALRESLNTYASGVSEAREFLMKDMGEDRWLCTLMVSNGWRLEYTAVSEDSTYCPEEFGEFYNQRRRWGPSTVANQIEILENYFAFGNEMRRDSVSFLFMVYQGLLFFSGLIGPATCVLIIAGGLQFFNDGTSKTENKVCNANETATTAPVPAVPATTAGGDIAAQTVSIATVVVLSLVSLLYGMICLCTSQKTQLRVAQFLSLCFAVLMTLVLVSLIEETVVEFSSLIHDLNNGCSHFPSISTMYFLALVGMYVITGLVHFTEFPSLLYGLVYFLALPTGYILLTLYSVCNLTDRTWGTREGSSSGQSADKSVTEIISDFFAKICGCCQRPTPTIEEVPLLEYEDDFNSDNEDEAVDTSSTSTTTEALNEGTTQESDTTNGRRRSTRVGHRLSVVTNRRTVSTISMPPEMAQPVPVYRWLKRELRDAVYIKFADKFLKEGYADTSFIAGMTDEDLKKIGIDTDFHREKLLTEIYKLTEFVLETSVPNNVTEWLKMLRLPEYIKTFKDYAINTKNDLACLRKTDFTKLMEGLKITKQAHIKRLKAAIGAMTEPDELQKDKNRVKKILMTTGWKIEELKKKCDNGKKEVKFWEALRDKKLNPDLGMFTSDVDLKAKLVGLRNSALVVLLVVNVLWITIMVVLSSRPALQVLGQNPMGFLSLAVFGLVQVIQFLAMMYHRLLTLLHAVARL